MVVDDEVDTEVQTVVVVDDEVELDEFYLELLVCDEVLM